VIAALAARGICGGDPRAIARTITMRDYYALVDYWRRHPPADLLVAAYVGYRPPDDRVITDAEEFVRFLGGLPGFSVKVH